MWVLISIWSQEGPIRDRMNGYPGAGGDAPQAHANLWPKADRAAWSLNTHLVNITVEILDDG